MDVLIPVSLYLMVLFAHLSRPRGAALATPIPASGETTTTLAWHTPCQGSTPSDIAHEDLWDDQPRPSKPLSQVYAELANIANQSKSAVYGVMQKYVSSFYDI